jgi:hypothetical protein
MTVYGHDLLFNGPVRMRIPSRLPVFRRPCSDAVLAYKAKALILTEPADVAIDPRGDVMFQS